MKNFSGKLLTFIFTATLFFCGFISSGECREFVFVVNTSQSMSASDPVRAVSESIVWSMNNLRMLDDVGIVTFSDEATIVRPLTQNDSDMRKNFNVNYYGRSNAGAGLLTAIDMLTPKFNKKRAIIFITNGEIDGAQSAENFKAGLEQAKWLDIQVYILELRHNADPKNYQLYGDYAKVYPINYNELLTTMRTILQGDFQTPHIQRPTNNVTNGTLNFNVPLTSVSTLKICLLSSKPGTASLNGVNAKTIFDGNFVKIFEVNAPQTNSYDLTINYPPDAGLTLDAILHFNGTLQTNISTALFVKDILEITPVNNGKKILDADYFDDKTIRLKVNDKMFTSKISDGSFNITLDGDTETVNINEVYFDELGAIYVGDYPGPIELPRKNYLPLILAVVGICTILILAYILNRRSKAAQENNLLDLKPTVPDENVALPISEKIRTFASGKSAYAGKLLIYITKNKSADVDDEPREFNLFRLNPADPISLFEILKKCSSAEGFSDVKDVTISPDREGIFIKNNSDCTVVKRNDLIAKGGRVELFYDDSVGILTADENAELLMVYKSLKPN